MDKRKKKTKEETIEIAKVNLKKLPIKFELFNLLFLALLGISFFVFVYFVWKVNILPTKYLIGGFLGIFVLLIVIIGMMFFTKQKKLRIPSYVLTVLLSALMLGSVPYLQGTFHFLSNTQVKDYGVLHYSVVVLKGEEYNNIKSLEGKTISYVDDDYKEKIEKILEKEISYQEQLQYDFGVLPDDLMNKKVDAICLEDSYYAMFQEEVENFEESTKVVYTFEVKTMIEENKKENDVSVSEESFILYISGIDQYGKVDSVRGRSDVNQLAVVNPKTHHILLVNTPRDYYVQLAGTTGLKDKLTHAGIYGIQKSIDTLEKFYGIDIQYYLRVNFDTLIRVVDVIGGVDINSDASFTCHTNNKVHVEKGWNHFNGAQALAYSRERYAYLTGDHHRGANQQQVITAIINKVSTSSVLIQKYNDILNSLDGSFQTDMSMDSILAFIRYQLDAMPDWNVESIAVSGFNSMDYTYSMGTGRKLYVMEPDMDSVQKAIARIQEVYNEK